MRKKRLRRLFITLGVIALLIIAVVVGGNLFVQSLIKAGVVSQQDITSTASEIFKYLIPLIILLVAIIIGLIAFWNKGDRFNYWFKWESLLAFIGVAILTVNLILTGPMVALMNVSQAQIHKVSAPTVQTSNTVSKDIAGEGTVLLKNSDHNLPVKAGKINVFGWASTNPIYGGTGSGASGDVAPVTLYQGLEHSGFKPNMQLYHFYRSYRKTRPTVGLWKQDWTLPEPKTSQYSNKMMKHAKKYSNTAVVVLARNGGEGADLPENMGKLPKTAVYHGNKGDFKNGQSYLQPSRSESRMLSMVNKNFKNVIVLINTGNPMQLGSLNRYNHVKSILWMSGPGQQGFNALGKVLNGEIDPSGRTVDTYLYNLKNQPSFNNFGNFKYANDPKMSYLNYNEGIYVGYKYFETRYGQNNSQYNRIVQYPFGYGLSYTRFNQRMSQLRQGRNGNLSYTVTVRNTGRRAGKDVVQTYYTAPYTNGGIEKASTNLLRFAKTRNLKPGQSQRLRFTVNRAEMASWDSSHGGRYVLDPGQYQIQLKNNSHDVVTSRNFNINNRIIYNANHKRPGDHQAPHDEFQQAKGKVTYLSRRNNFANANQALKKPIDEKASQHVIKTATMKQNYKLPKATGKMPTTGAHNNVKLAQLRGKSYNNPEWNRLLDELTPQQMQKLTTYGGYQTLAIPSIGKRPTYDFDGPAGLQSFMVHGLNISTFPTGDMVAATWNHNLANDKGQQVGQEGQQAGISGWYGPAMDIHRSAFGGRDFEYYSEDPQLSGTMAANEIKGAKKYGVYSYMKHFAMNEQETNRMGALNEWANEQSIRETYLKPFEMAVKDGGATATMSSYNFIGNQWAGANSHLLKNVLRNEWGYHGLVETDYFIGGFMNANQSLANGGDIMLSTNGLNDAKAQGLKNPTVVRQLRNASHDILYTVANSNAYSPKSNTNKSMTLPWRRNLYIIDVVLVVLIVIAECLLVYFDRRKHGQNEAK